MPMCVSIRTHDGLDHRHVGVSARKDDQREEHPHEEAHDEVERHQEEEQHGFLVLDTRHLLSIVDKPLNQKLHSDGEDERTKDRQRNEAREVKPKDDVADEYPTENRPEK
jgi:hypothetical protein